MKSSNRMEIPKTDSSIPSSINAESLQIDRKSVVYGKR